MKIPQKLYNQILEVMPRPCVDIVLRMQDKVLLLKRLLEPHKGYWSLPGGMIEKGETIEESAVRKCYEELGIKINPCYLRLIGAVTYITTRHDIGITYVLYVNQMPQIKMDYQHSEYKWFAINDLPLPLSPIVKEQVEKTV